MVDLSLNQMIQMYVDYDLKGRTWHMFYDMWAHNMISDEKWHMFCETCAGYEYNKEDMTQIIDTRNGNKLVWFVDDNGFWIKA